MRRNPFDQRFPKRKSGAFTLIELLAVIVIVLVLAALSMAGLQKSREYADRAKCMSNLRGIGIGVGVYTADNDGFLPPGSLSGVTSGGGNFVAALVPYTSPMLSPTMAPDIFYCPSNVRLDSPPAQGFDTPVPHYKGFGGYFINYVINESIFTIANAITEPGASRVRVNSVRMPSKTVALMDLPTRAPHVTAPPSSSFGNKIYFDPSSTSFALGLVHLNAGNVLFVDGHVQVFQKEKMAVASLPSQTTTWWP